MKNLRFQTEQIRKLFTFNYFEGVINTGISVSFQRIQNFFDPETKNIFGPAALHRKKSSGAEQYRCNQSRTRFEAKKLELFAVCFVLFCIGGRKKLKLDFCQKFRRILGPEPKSKLNDPKKVF